jgi:hypothetical protein
MVVNGEVRLAHGRARTGRCTTARDRVVSNIVGQLLDGVTEPMRGRSAPTCPIRIQLAIMKV